MVNIEVVPPYAIIDYVWDLLKLNTSMKLSDYNGRIPVIPSSQQPEFTDLDKPFIVYAWSETPTTDMYKHRSGQISFAIYGKSDREISKISNIVSTALGMYDDSAFNINNWKSENTSYGTIRFTSLWSGAFDGPSPESQEGGRQSGVVLIRYRYIADYQLTLP